MGKYNASLYFNPATGIKVIVHGDDFVAVGERDHIGAFRKQIANRFTVKDKVIGMRADLGEVMESRILNRVVRVTTEGWEYEAGQRHADMIVKELGLSNAKVTKTHGKMNQFGRCRKARRSSTGRW